MSYSLNGILWDDRQTVVNALDDPSIPDYEKQRLVDEHNWRHLDNMSTNNQTNRTQFDIPIRTGISYYSGTSSQSYHYESNSQKFVRLNREKRDLKDKNATLLREGNRAASPFPAFLFAILFSALLAVLFFALDWPVPMLTFLPFDTGEYGFFVAAGLILYVFLKIIWYIVKKRRIAKMGTLRFKEYSSTIKRLLRYDEDIRKIKAEKKAEKKAQKYSYVDDSCACNGTGGCY